MPFYAPRIGVTGSALTRPQSIAGTHMALVAWGDRVSCNGLCAVRFSLDGVPLDAQPHAIAGASGVNLLAMATDGETFLTAQSNGGNVMLVKVEADGSSRTVAMRGQVNGIALAWDGAAYLIAEAYPQLVQIARIRPDGSLVANSTRTLSFAGATQIVAAANADGQAIVSWDPMDVTAHDPPGEKIHLLPQFPSLPYPPSIVTNGRGFLAGLLLLDENGQQLGTLPTFGLGGARTWNGSEYVALQANGRDLAFGPAGTLTPAVVPLPHTNNATVSGPGIVPLSGGKLLLTWLRSYYSGFDSDPIGTVFAAVFDGTTLSSMEAISNGPLQQVGVATATCGDTAVVAWVERGSTTRVRLGRVRRDGSLVDGEGLSADASVAEEVLQGEPVVACSASSFAVAWKERPSPDSAVRLKVAFFPNATPELPRVAVASNGTYAQRLASLASDGAHYLVAWSDPSFIAGLRFTSDGFALDPEPVSLSRAPGEGQAGGYDNGVAVRWDGTDWVVVWVWTGSLTEPLYFVRLRPDLVRDGPRLDRNSLYSLVQWFPTARFSVVQTSDGWFVRQYAVQDEARIWIDRTGMLTKAYPTRYVTRQGNDNLSVAYDGRSVLTIDNAAITARDINDAVSTAQLPDPVVALAGFHDSLPLVIVARGAALAVIPPGLHPRAVR